jgi:hypothetical protein
MNARLLNLHLQGRKYDKSPLAECIPIWILGNNDQPPCQYPPEVRLQTTNSTPARNH